MGQAQVYEPYGGVSLSKIPRHERYGLFWRLRWNLEYGLMHVYGPADLDEERDPQAEMRRDCDLRKAAHEARQSVASAR